MFEGKIEEKTHFAIRGSIHWEIIERKETLDGNNRGPRDNIEYLPQ